MISTMKNNKKANKPMKNASHKPEFTEDDALAFFARHLDGLNWKYHHLPEAPVLFSGFNGKDVLWDFNMIARAKGDGLFHLSVNSFIPNKVPADRRQKIAETLTRINWELNLGCFEMNFADGEIRFRTGITLPAADITEGVVEHLIRSNICIVDERIHQILAALYSDMRYGQISIAQRCLNEHSQFSNLFLRTSHSLATGSKSQAVPVVEVIPVATSVDRCAQARRKTQLVHVSDQLALDFNVGHRKPRVCTKPVAQGFCCIGKHRPCLLRFPV
jgi:hypothetical protein